MASQNDAGEVILGDSHEYDPQIEPFDKSIIDDLMLRELRRIITLPAWEIAQRWHGIYAKHRELPIIEVNPIPGVHVSTATGGSGMTMSFGLAARFWGTLDAAA
jgi:glycine/D-amino acid oxidase-like deaminating enzyme